MLSKWTFVCKAVAHTSLPSRWTFDIVRQRQQFFFLKEFFFFAYMEILVIQLNSDDSSSYWVMH